jgi:hypothetical protein
MKNQAFDFSVDLLSALLWRHNEADHLTSLLQQKQNWYDDNQEGFWNDWFTDVFDLKTANSFGCAVWAVILGVPLAVILPPATRPTFGFGAFHRNFTRGNFAPVSQNVLPLSLPQQRLVLRLRYAQLISRGNVTDTNRILKYIFNENGYGNVYVLDGLNMKCTYVFTFAIPSALQFVLTNYDILPRPAGVGIQFVVTTRGVFGFGAPHRNFTRGNFGA